MPSRPPSRSDSIQLRPSSPPLSRARSPSSPDHPRANDHVSLDPVQGPTRERRSHSDSPSDTSTTDQIEQNHPTAIRHPDKEQRSWALRGSYPSSHHHSNAVPLTEPMSARGDALVMQPRHYYDEQKTRDIRHPHPSPPPIATLQHSPSLSTSSLDRSSVSSPAPGARPLGVDGMQTQSSYSTPPSYYSHNQPVKRSSKSYYHTTVDAPPVVAQNYPYGSQRVYDQGYRQESALSLTGHHFPSGYGGSTHALPSLAHITQPAMRTAYAPTHSYPGSNDFAIVLTDDASTKLSDRVRRRCFNCCTTDTSTWRRSTLNPGKVLCNKCGLFERTHSRPRPDQFPHKRGHLSTPSARSRTPPTQLPSMPPQAHALPPHSYAHPSIAPLLARADTHKPVHPNVGQGPQQWRYGPGPYSPPSVSRKPSDVVSRPRPLSPPESRPRTPPESTVPERPRAAEV